MRYHELVENTDDDDLFATPRIAFNDLFNEYDEDELVNRGFEYGDNPEQDIEILNDYLEGYKNFRVTGLSGGEHDLVLYLDRSSQLKETDDDELFGESVNKKIAKWLHNYAVRMQQEPDHWSAFSADEGDEYENDIAEIREQGQVLQSIAQTFATEGLREGLRVFGYRAHEYDNWWWDRIAPELNDETGISLEDLVDEINIGESENPDHDDDDDMFGSPSFNAEQAGKLIASTGATSGELVDPESIQNALEHAANRVLNSPVIQNKAREQLEKWMTIDDDTQWELVDEIANMVYEINGDGWEPEDTIYNESDDDELFGRGLHHRIAAALLAQAEEDQRIADEERGLGDLENAAEFAKQASNYRYIADAFNQSMLQGVKVYRSLDRSWRQAVDDVVDIDLDMDFRDYEKQIPESADDDELFGRTSGNFAGMSAQDVKDRWDELNDELYGYEAYWSDEDDAEFQQKESELKALMRYARIRFGEAFYQYLSNWREHSDAQHARWQERTRADPFSNRRYREDPRITKSGKINKQDQKTLARDIKDRVGTHRQPVLPENMDDDDLFSTSAKLDRRQELKAKAIRRIEKRDALNIQPGTRLMVKWDNGKYYKGKVVRLTPSGRVIVQVKFHNVGWPLEKNISPRDIKPEHIID